MCHLVTHLTNRDFKWNATFSYRWYVWLLRFNVCISDSGKIRDPDKLRLLHNPVVGPQWLVRVSPFVVHDRSHPVRTTGIDSSKLDSTHDSLWLLARTSQRQASGSVLIKVSAAMLSYQSLLHSCSGFLLKRGLWFTSYCLMDVLNTAFCSGIDSSLLALFRHACPPFPRYFGPGIKPTSRASKSFGVPIRTHLLY